MTITEDRDVVIGLAGRIDSFAIEELYEGFEQVKKIGKLNVVLMMTELDYINSRGIATLISFFKWAKEEGRSVKLAQVPKNIMALLTLLASKSSRLFTTRCLKRSRASNRKRARKMFRKKRGSWMKKANKAGGALRRGKTGGKP
jgi:anti-anti-sigma factor